MNKSDLKKLSKSQLIKMLLKQDKPKPTKVLLKKKSKHNVVIVDDKPKTVKNKKLVSKPGWVRNPTTCRLIKIDGYTYKKLYPLQYISNTNNKRYQEIEKQSIDIDDKYKSIMSSLDDVKPSSKPSERPIPKSRTYKPVSTPRFNKPKYKARPPKPTRAPPLPPNDGFNFDNDIFQTENTSLGKFKIISVQSRENKKFKSYTNEFKVKILKKLDDVNEIYYIFQELVKTLKKRRKLSNNDMIKVVIQNEELPNAISTKFNKVESFKLGDLENIINIMEYCGIPLETSKIIVQSVKIPTGKGRLYLTKDTISRKGCIIMVKNDDTTCLARSIVTSMANLHSERWTKTQLHDGFNKSRKLQKEEAMKLHEEANVKINDYGNDLSDIEKFTKHLGIEINIIDAEQFNSIVHTANKGSEDKIYLLKTRNHFDVIKSLTAFYDTPYYCHECKKAYTKRDKHKCPSKCLSCFTYTKDTKCEGKEIICEKCNRKFFGKRCFKNHLKNRSKVEDKMDIVCDAVKKCNDCL